jgi:hypothetical protein
MMIYNLKIPNVDLHQKIETKTRRQVTVTVRLTQRCVFLYADTLFVCKQIICLFCMQTLCLFCKQILCFVCRHFVCFVQVHTIPQCLQCLKKCASNIVICPKHLWMVVDILLLFTLKYNIFKIFSCIEDSHANIFSLHSGTNKGMCLKLFTLLIFQLLKVSFFLKETHFSQ